MLKTPWPWSARLALVAGVLALVESLLSGQLRTAAVGTALGVTLGGGLGLAMDLLGLPLRRLPRLAALIVWPLLCIGGALWLARALGIFARLEGEYASLAWGALAASSLSAIFGGLALATLQPTRTDPAALVSRLSKKGRRWVVGALLAGALGALLADRLLFVGLYPIAHAALRLATLAGFGAALFFHRSWRPTLRRWATLLAALAMVTIATFASLHAAPVTLAKITQPFGACWLDTLRSLTDVDGDGFSGMLTGGDIAPWDPAVSLTAAGDNVLDPTLGDLKLYPGEGPAPLSVIFISIDTLRPDHLGVYGHSRDTSPNIDALAARSTRYTRAYTAGTWTSLAMSAAHRGIYPRRMHWTHLVETSKYRLLRKHETSTLRDGERLRLWFGLPVEDPRPTLAQRLRARGMATLAVVDDGYSQFFNPHLGAGDGFDSFKVAPVLRGSRPNNAGTSDLAITALAGVPADTSFFMWVHYFGAHGPNRRFKDVPKYGKSRTDRYDHMVRQTDQELGRFLDAIERVRATRPVLVVLTSDHGETFSKKRHHGNGVTEGQVRIPLLISGPGFDPGVDDRLASIVDIAPTVLAATQTPTGQAVFDGLDLAQPAPKGRVILAETWRYRADMKPRYDVMALMNGRKVLTFDRRRNSRKTTWQRKQGLPRAKSLKTPATLEAALKRYLNQTRGGAVHWQD